MGRELKARLEGRYQYTIGDLSTNPDEELHQRIFVQQGIITARARRIGHIENNLPWFGGTEGKTRLDRRHHAVDASVIALMTPAVAAVIYKGDNLRKEQRDFMIPIAWVKESVPDDYCTPRKYRTRFHRNERRNF
jgi:CRISPR-associated endonuclease Csn1